MDEGDGYRKYTGYEPLKLEPSEPKFRSEWFAEQDDDPYPFTTVGWRLVKVDD